ncbi:MAG: DNA polymerase III subunit delta' [Litorilituus sp.]|jgi:DNA polymerase-3 subunit delta'|nr:DNA polymerase III subunit delta' [Litorilituus sp.]
MQPWLRSYQQLLSLQYSNQQLPHAILINGVAGAGKSLLAQWLMHLLNCQQPISQDNQVNKLQACGQCKTCLLMHSNTLPDHLNLQAEKNSLGIDEIRHANDFLHKTAQFGMYKTVLITHAETMTPAAANALLKTLEEPTDYSVIVLITADIEALLPTIVSRCRVFHIQPDVGERLLDNLQQQGKVNSNNLTKCFVNLTQLPELTDDKVYELFEGFKRLYLNYLYYQQDEALLLQQVLDNKHALRWLEQITVNLQRDQLIKAANLQAEKIVLDTHVLNKLYKVIVNGDKVIKAYTQSNKQFVCQQLIMSISQVIEQAQIGK